MSSRFIVIGIKSYPDGKKDFIGVNEQLVDEANYQKLISDNIEPEIKLEYFSLEVRGVTLAIIHIYDCDNPPYMMQKDFGRLKKGYSFIRKGSFQSRLSRKDLDNILVSKFRKEHTENDIEIKVLSNGEPIDRLKTLDKVHLPSEKKKEKIEQILKEKEAKLANKGTYPFFLDQDLPQIGGTPYENRSIKTLQGDLEQVNKTYYHDDLYYLFEESAYKLNLELLNKGTSYLEDASILVEIDNSDGLNISEEVISKPIRRSWLDNLKAVTPLPNLENLNYPLVVSNEVSTKVSSEIGDIKHLIPTLAFKTELRLFLTKEFPLSDRTLNVNIFGKHLKKPIVLKIKLPVDK
ncbi:MAG: hypothetical protein EOO46_24445 [Flavobacterium sp.]|nr:MAG: hypothetical protein EOO46_24445 [Flavobacterium sp.]